ncbi:hypothetical protein Ait01nite_026060 [Actinoplanes italicus]|uniref:Uncharacterized protein n=1 Tax=Actinoplanes italicus TaxID=113567 RepID=A0A2T0KF66_9ACTN|nr:hypothetical protein [Actinoplanes italicus]PRX22020.1 hypothetical protein CLV67_105197 [Actinoplanes italicus]GIE29561.1 hypothetical protein Ait01nite_026060 [Actinoplanes italicus]
MVQDHSGAGSFGYDQRPATPRSVQIVAAGVALLGVLNIVRIVVQTVMTFGGDGWSTGARTVFLVLNAIPFAVSVFFLPLAYQLLRGRSWAWVTAIVLVSLSTAIGTFMLLITVTSGGFPLGPVMFGVPLVVLLGLIVPRSVRAFFSKPAPVPYPTYPAQGPWTS